MKEDEEVAISVNDSANLHVFEDVLIFTTFSASFLSFLLYRKHKSISIE